MSKTMKINAEIVEPYLNRNIYVLKDELGNTATGLTYNEACRYLLARRKKVQKRKR